MIRPLLNLLRESPERGRLGLFAVAGVVAGARCLATSPRFAVRGEAVLLDGAQHTDPDSIQRRLAPFLGKNSFAVDLADVNYLDSTGLGVLIGGLKRTRDKGGELVLICPNVRIMRIFDITGLSRIFEMFKTESEALDRLKRRTTA